MLVENLQVEFYLSVCLSIRSTLNSAFQLLPPLPKSVDNESEENQSIEDFISYPRKLQYRLCTKTASSEVGELLAHVSSDRDAAKVTIFTGKRRGIMTRGNTVFW